MKLYACMTLLAICTIIMGCGDSAAQGTAEKEISVADCRQDSQSLCIVVAAWLLRRYIAVLRRFALMCRRYHGWTEHRYLMSIMRGLRILL